MKKLCLYFNIPSSYREEIYTRINNEYDCEWYFEESSEPIKRFELDGFKHFYLPIRKIGGFYWTKGMLGLLKRDCDNYIMLGATRCLSLYVFLLLKHIFYPKKRVCLWTHGYYGKEIWIEKALFKKPLFKMADKVLLYGNYARGLMIKDGFNSDKLLTIHNSLAYSEQSKLRNAIKPSGVYSNHFGNDNYVIIFLGRLTKVKKLDMILDAVSQLKNRGENYNVVFVGDGIERKNLEFKAESLGLQNQVWFYGACYDENTNAELVYNADLCVAPGNVGLTAIHSLMFGCPVITHDDLPWQMPEFEAIHEGSTGSFFERDNLASLADTISNWFKTRSGMREQVRHACFDEIDTQWNPDFQMKVIEKAML